MRGLISNLTFFSWCFMLVSDTTSAIVEVAYNHSGNVELHNIRKPCDNTTMH